MERSRFIVTSKLQRHKRTSYQPDHATTVGQHGGIWRAVGFSCGICGGGGHWSESLYKYISYQHFSPRPLLRNRKKAYEQYRSCRTRSVITNSPGRRSTYIIMSNRVESRLKQMRGSCHLYYVTRMDITSSTRVSSLLPTPGKPACSRSRVVVEDALSPC